MTGFAKNPPAGVSSITPLKSSTIWIVMRTYGRETSSPMTSIDSGPLASPALSSSCGHEIAGVTLTKSAGGVAAIAVAVVVQAAVVAHRGEVL